MQTTVITDKKEKLSDDKLNQMNLFFYCSSPSKGFHMKKINAVTGEVLLEGEEATDAMPENAFEITTRSGARMALYKTAYGHCFVAKGIESVKADKYGRYKYVNIAFEVAKEQGMMITQLAAWALFDFAKFSVAITDCMSVYDGPRGYEINMEKLQQLFSCFDKKICRIPSRYQASWNKLMNQSTQKIFQFVVIDISINHFRESTRISIGDEQIAYKISIGKLEQWKKNPLMLEFSEEIYQEEQRYGEKNPIDKIQPETVQEENVEEIIELDEANETIEQEQKDARGVKDIDYINLLDKKWFLPIVICGVAALVLFLIFLLKKIT